MAISVLIIKHCHDEISLLEDIMSDYSGLEVLEPALTLADADEILAKKHPSLILIDEEMPDGNGMEYWNSFRMHASWNVYTIFFTSIEKHAVNTLQVRAHDCILKPFERAHVESAMQRFFLYCVEYFVKTDEVGRRECVTQGENEILVLDHISNRVKLHLSDIGYFSYIANRKVWEVFCTNGKVYSLRHGVNSSRILALSTDLEQVHKSFIVNIKYLNRIEENKIILSPPFDNDTVIHLSRQYRNTLLNHFEQL